ncbi:hypothetical protein [Nesterenkonia alba]|uniref:hypothetical protein n=1 Tax=Nesterenkonia alba TaxID=515814 RepID=UPI0012EC323D|nr:hypothetical protein [Nesterenkonia alba]
MRWNKQVDWGPRPLTADQWAPLRAQIAAEDLDEVEEALEELTGFMEYFRTDVVGTPLVGVTDGQLSVVHRRHTDTWGRDLLEVTFYAAGPVGQVEPHAFDRLAKAAAALVDHLAAEGIVVERIDWTQQPYIGRPF